MSLIQLNSTSRLNNTARSALSIVKCPDLPQSSILNIRVMNSLSDNTASAIDIDKLSADHTGLVGAEEGDEIGQVIFVDSPSHWRPADSLIDELPGAGDHGKTSGETGPGDYAIDHD